jgi:hypothetical protein
MWGLRLSPSPLDLRRLEWLLRGPVPESEVDGLGVGEEEDGRSLSGFNQAMEPGRYWPPFPERAERGP